MSTGCPGVERLLHRVRSLGLDADDARRPVARPSRPSAVPEMSPPPPIGTTTISTSGTCPPRSRRRASAWPAITTSSSKGWTSVRPVASRSSRSRSYASGSVARLEIHGRPVAARRGDLRAGSRRSPCTTSASIPSTAAPNATAAAAFPAEIVMTPRSRSSGPREEILARIPRGLKEPVRWKSSALRWAVAPVRSDEGARAERRRAWSRFPTARIARSDVVGRDGRGRDAHARPLWADRHAFGTDPSPTRADFRTTLAVGRRPGTPFFTRASISRQTSPATASASVVCLRKVVRTAFRPVLAATR